MESRIRWPLALLLVAVIARVAAALAIGGEFHFADEAIYLDAARRLSGGDGFGAAYRKVPAYPVFLSCCHSAPRPASCSSGWLRGGGRRRYPGRDGAGRAGGRAARGGRGRYSLTRWTRCW